VHRCARRSFPAGRAFLRHRNPLFGFSSQNRTNFLHTVPSVKTLEKYARALEVPMYKLFIEGDETPRKPKVSLTESAEPTWGGNENERRELSRFAKALSRMDAQQRKLLLAMATRMANQRARHSG